MKRTLRSLASGLALLGGAFTLHAAPLQRSQVSADAKWLLHLDAEALQKSKTGAALLQFALDQAGESFKTGLKLDLSAVLSGTDSLTAWGPDFKPGPEGRGVLIWRGEKEVEQAVTGILVQQAEAHKAGEGAIRVERGGPEPVYCAGEKVWITVRPGRGILVSPNFEQLDEVCQVMDGKAPGLEGEETFSRYPALPGGFFFLAVVDGFPDGTGMPAQAQVLKLADRGRVALGEEADRLRLSVNLEAQNAECAMKIQQVLQGVIALASLTQVEDPELARMQEWVRGAQVKAEEKMVSFDLAVPVEAALKQLNMQTAPAAKPQAESAPAAAPRAEPQAETVR